MKIPNLSKSETHATGIEYILNFLNVYAEPESY